MHTRTTNTQNQKHKLFQFVEESKNKHINDLLNSTTIALSDLHGHFS